MFNLKFNLLLIVFLSAIITSRGGEADSLNTGARRCLKCHGQSSYSFTNTLTRQSVRKPMNPFFILDTVQLVTGVHHSFNCTDCHSSDYETYPHAGELKMMPMANCLDCHGGEVAYAGYQFERIDKEFQKSVHFIRFGEKFDCSKCHNQHYYKAVARNSTEVKEIVTYNNGICLTCHGNATRFNLLSDTRQQPLEKIHEWLPNQELHFRNVRCIECHTQVADKLLVSHHILPGEDARQNCEECHSSNSVLKASLYKYQNLQLKLKKGTLNALGINESYVIGANQNPFLKTLSILILLVVLAGIIIHIIFRILK